MIELDRVSVSLGRHRVLHDVSIRIEDGEWATLVGPNGGGKTTLLRAVAGLVAYSGTVALQGQPADRLGRRGLARLVALVPQSPLMPAAMSVFEYVVLGRTPHISYLGSESRRDLEAAEEAMVRLELVELAARPLGELSGGERQRAVLARSLVQEAPILLLDEPTSALDIGHQQQAFDLLDSLRGEAGLTVVSAMHDLTLASQYAERVVLIDGGRVVAEGPPQAVLTEERLREHYAASVRVLEHAGGIAVVPVRR
jgi:iron complex transport system ATP-binding protein